MQERCKKLLNAYIMLFTVIFIKLIIDRSVQKVSSTLHIIVFVTLGETLGLV